VLARGSVISWTRGRFNHEILQIDAENMLGLSIGRLWKPGTIPKSLATRRLLA
jgi:hypothetical protein